MKCKEKKSKRSIKWIFFAYCIILVLIMLVVVWTMRLLFVDSTFKQVRTSIAEGTVKELSSVIDDGKNFKKTADQIANNTDTVVYLLDGNGNIVHTSSGKYNGYSPTSKELDDIRASATNSKKQVFAKEIEIKGDTDNGNKVLIYAKNIRLGENNVIGIGPYEAGMGTIVLTCRIAPMTTTIQTINFELLIVTIIMVVIALVSAVLLARHISKPIIEMNAQSSRLASGDYDVQFSEGGYREISELGETLNYTASELQKADKMRRDLIANVSHDLRTPLTMIRGYVEMMRDIPNEATIENMNVILKETDYLTKLVNDMLDMSKIEAGAIKFSTSEFDLNALLVDIRDRYNALYKQQGYTFSYEPNDEPIIVTSDKVMLTNVIYNLMNNAINHIGSDNAIALTREIVNGRMRIHVIDHGEGIPKDIIDNIWDRYYKGERNLKRERAGSGLGLSIVKQVLTKLDCSFGVTSEEGKGSDFYFDIDYNSDSDENEDEEDTLV